MTTNISQICSRSSKARQYMAMVTISVACVLSLGVLKSVISIPGTLAGQHFRELVQEQRTLRVLRAASGHAERSDKLQRTSTQHATDVDQQMRMENSTGDATVEENTDQHEPANPELEGMNATTGGTKAEATPSLQAQPRKVWPRLFTENPVQTATALQSERETLEKSGSREAAAMQANMQGMDLRQIDLPYLLVEKGDMRLRKSFFEKYSYNNSVMVIGVNQDYIPLARNLMCSLRAFDPQTSFRQIVVWAFQTETVAELLEMRRKLAGEFGVYYLEPYPGASSMRPGSEGFKMAMRQGREKFWTLFFETGLDMLFSDADIVFFRDPLTSIVSNDGYGPAGKPLDGPEVVDLVVSTDPRKFRKGEIYEDGHWKEFEVCAGLFWVRNSAKTKEFFGKIFKYINEMGDDYRHDQGAINVVLEQARPWLIVEPPLLPWKPHDESPDGHLRVRVLDQTKFISGHVYRYYRQEYERNLQSNHLTGKTQHAIHINQWDLDKIGWLKQIGIWFATDDGFCWVPEGTRSTSD